MKDYTDDLNEGEVMAEKAGLHNLPEKEVMQKRHEAFMRELKARHEERMGYLKKWEKEMTELHMEAMKVIGLAKNLPVKCDCGKDFSEIWQ